MSLNVLNVQGCMARCSQLLCRLICSNVNKHCAILACVCAILFIVRYASAGFPLIWESRGIDLVRENRGILLIVIEK